LTRNDLFNLIFSFFSLQGNSIFIWILVILTVIFIEEKKRPGFSIKDKKFVIVFLSSFLLTALLTTFVVKNVFRRPRPFFRTDYSRYELSKPTLTSACPVDFSFPSGHASTAFAAATVLTAFDKRRRWFYYTIAVLISYSRIYLGCHYFLDTVAGAGFGYLVSQIILRLSALDTFPFRKKN
jgi:undecaprenyl-diphosphatase